MSSVVVPQSIPEMVAGIDAIVVGTMGSSISETIIPHPTITGNLTPGSSTIIDPHDPSEPVTDFLFTPTDVLLSDGMISVNEPMTVRLNGHIGDVPVGIDVDTLGWPQTTRQYLLFLYRNVAEPPGDTYSPGSGIYDSILVDGAKVTYSDGADVAFADGMTPSEFIEAVRAEAQLQFGP